MACFPKDFRDGFRRGVESRGVRAFLFGLVTSLSVTGSFIARGRIPIYLDSGAG